VWDPPFHSCTTWRVCPKWLHFLVIFLCPYSQIGLPEVIWIQVSLHWVDVSSIASVSQSESRTGALIMFVLAFWWLYDHLTLCQEVRHRKISSRADWLNNGFKGEPAAVHGCARDYQQNKAGRK
jgi:hypothetical protein